MAPKSILRNAPSDYSPREDTEPNSPGVDRTKVLENTRANAQLHNVGATIKQHEDESRVERAEENYHNENGLTWDEANIYLNEQDKTAKMKIDEPKTPYQGAIGESEYYLPDEEEEAVKTKDGERRLNVDELDGFSLGEPQYEHDSDPTVQNDRIEKVDMGDDDEEQDEENDGETAEERHRRFEEMRKAHYHMKANPLKQPMPPVEDDE